MSEEYRVIYSGRVRELLTDLITMARNLTVGQEALDSLREIDRRLKIYPQFGEPFRDLRHIKGTEWIGFVGPLIVRYVILEDERQVWVVQPLSLSSEQLS